MKVVTFTFKEVEKLIKDLEEILPESETIAMKQALCSARISPNDALRDFVGMWALACKADAHGQPPIEKYHGFPQAHLNGHLLDLGMPGTGKTVTGNLQLIDLITKQNETFTGIVQDSEGDRAPHIITELEKAGRGDQWLYFDHTTIRENLFELADIDPLWFTEIASIFVELGFFGDIGLGLVREYATDANAIGERQRRNGWASFNEFITHVEQTKPPKNSKRAQYKDVCLERFKLWLPVIGDLFSCRSGYDWNIFRNKIIIFNISNLSPDAQLFWQIYTLRKLIFMRNHNPDPTPLIYDLDEVWKFLVSAEQKSSPYQPAILSAARAARKRNIHIFYKDQFFQLLPPTLTGSCSQLFIFRMRDQDDLRKVQRELNLTTEQVADIPTLEDQECYWINKNMKKPVRCRIPDVDLSNLLTYDEINALMKPKLEKLSWEPVVRKPRIKSDGIKNESDQRFKVVLEAVWKTHGKSLKEARKQTPLSQKQFDTALSILVEMGAVSKPEPLSFGLRGNPPQYAEVLEHGAKILGQSWEEVQFKYGKTTSLEGKIMTFIVAEYLKGKNYKVMVEAMGADILATKPGIRGDTVVAYEIETSPTSCHIAKNARRDLAQIADKCIIVTNTVDQMARAKELCKTRLRQDEVKRIVFKQTKEFMKSK